MIIGSTVTLRHVEQQDLGRLVAMVNDLGSRGEFVPGAMISPQLLRGDHAATGLSSSSSEHLIVINANDTVVGFVIHHGSSHDREVGYQIQPEHRRKGFGREAVLLLVDYLFKSRAISRLSARIDPRNKASASLAIQIGFLKEGTVRKSIFQDGEFVDYDLYGLPRVDWRTTRQRSP